MHNRPTAHFHAGEIRCVNNIVRDVFFDDIVGDICLDDMIRDIYLDDVVRQLYH